MRHIETLQEIRDMARGAVFLGSGGGGDPYVGEVFLARQLEQGRRPAIVPASELADDAFVLSIAGVGAPTVLVEHLVSEKTLLKLLADARAYYGRDIDALISAEIGGANSIFPLALGARAGIPVVDGDGMGRAFPHLEMTTFSVFGCPATPALLMDDSGNTAVVNTANDRTAEDVVRAVASSLGAMLMGAFYPMSGKQAKALAVHGTISQTIEIGRTIREARERTGDPVRALVQSLEDPARQRHARLLFQGKIQDVRHETRDGWHWGSVRIASTEHPADELTVDIQNEYLVARRAGRTVAVVPDLISVLDLESAEPLTAEMLHYGQRVAVVGYSAAPIMRSAEGLAVFGPRMFKIAEDFAPVEALNPAGAI